ncbi:alpha/beta hydrolase family protein [Microbacterium sp. bgisy189]|uniref:alpha/beta hydrolase family protein n=1 Tax=Microbacterium sp. bgisy189 TaxID=3413798 RepID=UPI003EBDBF1B
MSEYSEPTHTLPVPLPAGVVEVPVTTYVAADSWAVLALAHGAGAGRNHPFMVGFARAAAEAGVTTVTFDFPYRVAGRRMPGPAAHAIAAWDAVAGHAASLAEQGVWFAAGKSYGGRMASMAAAEGRIAPAGLAYLGYPLHPPGDPEKARTAHLPDITQPQLFVEGSNDPFIHPLTQLEEAVAACRDAEISWVTGGGHSFEIKGAKRPADEVGAGLAVRVVEWMRAIAQRPAA